MSERFLCRKDSGIAREMIDRNLSPADKPFGLHLAGITAHVYADTFSHYGFSGVSSRWNRIDSSSFDLVDVEPEILDYIRKRESRFREKYGEEAGELPNIRDPERWNVGLSSAISRLRDRSVSDAAEILSGAPGHGAALTYPDRPYLRWRFDYEYPRKRSSGLRHNSATFLEGCEKLRNMFRQPGIPGEGGGALNDEAAAETARRYLPEAMLRHEGGAAPANLRILRARGDSMVPAVHDGDRLLVDIARKTPATGEMAVLRGGVGPVVKRVEVLPDTDPPRLRPISANPAYEPYTRLAGEAHMVGTVIRTVSRV